MSSESPDLNAALMMARMEAMTRDMADIKTSIRDLATAFTRLAVIEERQLESTRAIERAFGEVVNLQTQIDGVDDRVRVLEVHQPENSNTKKLVQAVVMVVITAVITAWVTSAIQPKPTTPYHIAPQR